MVHVSLRTLHGAISALPLLIRPVICLEISTRSTCDVHLGALLGGLPKEGMQVRPEKMETPMNSHAISTCMLDVDVSMHDNFANPISAMALSSCRKRNA